MASFVEDKYRMNMCEGPLFSKIVRFATPLYFSIVLQLMFNAADMIVVGRFTTEQALAAVGSTSSLSLLTINLFIGLSVGTNVVAANFYGAKDADGMERITHTAMLVALIGGILVGAAGIVFAREMLLAMDTPEDVIDKSTLYMQIYYAGMPFFLVYHFGSSILRALGDTRRPLYFLTTAGIINVGLNLLFVLKFGMDVDGVAWATTISQGISAVLVWSALAMEKDACRLEFRKLRIHWGTLKPLMRIGLPAGAQGACFSLSNVLIQSSVNGFGSQAMAGNAACLSLEGIVYVGSFTFYQTALSFCGQNLGGKQLERIKRSIWYCFWLAIGLCTLVGWWFYLKNEFFLGIYNSNPAVIEWGARRMKWDFTMYALCGTMDVMSGSMRGLGKSLTSAIVTLVGVCVLRLAWVYTIFRIPEYHTMEVLILSYPFSWGITTLVNGSLLVMVCRKLKEKLAIAN